MKKEQEHTVDSSNVVYVSEQLDVKDAALEAFSDVFARFQLPSDEDTVREYTASLFLHALTLLSPGRETHRTSQR